ncbi:MAG: lactate dehydrogenase [Fluviicoccus sp.]|uniref:class I SAM-dependent DNA methyltransferase n=1 Tax=Fluviicoccus sp. TaxID=2003552 RepID=UPI00271D4242|nr:DNA methyltransferase [Fluviicoccus sp.]MDO8329334.1 lactate dehydrogenase [Fluviicoccus sp.]
MNAVEIESAISDLAEQPFDADEFPYAFLAAFGNKDTTLKRLRTGNNNASDVTGGVLQRNNIHIAVCAEGAVGDTLKTLRTSPSTTKAKARFILATDGQTLEAEELAGGETVACAYADFPNHFGFFLPLAGISTIKEIKDNPVDVRATGRLNKLYVELLRENPDWATDERRHDMNHFMARLIFCFFAEDTGIFNNTGLFTKTVEQMSERDGSNTHDVLECIFRAMNIKYDDRANVQPRLPVWTNNFPYVNGGLFSGSTEAPRFTRMARSYLSHAGNLNWQQINPDIFGSMIQAVADDEERGALGMHYTSVPNILKVLNPLFLDDLRAQLAEAGDNERKLLNLRKRMARIRVFDPACGSGNFLVIAYKQMREIEAEVNRRRGEEHLGSEIPLTNFRGIELRDFPAEIARLALIIAEFQCDVLYRGQQDALQEFLPLDAQNWIVCGNALRLDWLSVCPPTGARVKAFAYDLFQSQKQAEIGFENEGGETFICGNPPYLGFTWQSADQKSDLHSIFDGRTSSWKSLDYVCAWFMKAADYGSSTLAASAFVCTNSICQGEQVPILWPLIFEAGHDIFFAHTSFKWANLASNKAVVTVAIVGISSAYRRKRRLFSLADDGVSVIEKQVDFINAYLVTGPNVIVSPISKPSDARGKMEWGNKPSDGGGLVLSLAEAENVIRVDPLASRFIYDFVGAQEFVRGVVRRCLWIGDSDAEEAKKNDFIASRLAAVRKMRLESPASSTQAYASKPHRFRQIQGISKEWSIVVPKVTSESRLYLPVGLLPSHSIVSDNAFALYDAPLWNMALIASRLHLVWIGTVCGKMKTDFRYSNTMGWNTFPVPLLTEQNKADLTRCAENILLAREAHFPATIADLYEVKDGVSQMPDNLRHAHEHNDEVLERIYIGRRFKNDTERLEKLFELYTKMTAETAKGKPPAKAARGKKV